LLLPLLLALPARSQDGTVANTTVDAYSQPLPGLTADQQQAFLRGRSLFRQSWVVAPARDQQVDGLGPLYNRLACVSCHAGNGRGKAPTGPDARMQAMLVRLSVAGQDAHGGPRPHPVYGDQLSEEGIPGVPAEGRARLEWETLEATLQDGEVVPLRRPRIAFFDLGYGPLGPVQTSARVGQPVFGLGLLAAVPDRTLQALARTHRPDGVRGRLNQVWQVPEGRSAPGRFGWKSSQPNLRQQVASAMIGDLGITSTLFPQNNCTPAQVACRAAPHGGTPELSKTQLDDLTAYLALLAVPAPREPDAPQIRQGRLVFDRAGCTACHLPVLRTGPHAWPALSNRTIAPYTDLLLHDMGPGLADNRPDFRATGRQWRTPPLWGIGLSDLVGEDAGYLHDGRARTLQEAIVWHGGEAQAARNRYAALPRAEREALLAFLRSL